MKEAKRSFELILTFVVIMLVTSFVSEVSVIAYYVVTLICVITAVVVCDKYIRDFMNEDD